MTLTSIQSLGEGKNTRLVCREETPHQPGTVQEQRLQWGGDPAGPVQPPLTSCSVHHAPSTALQWPLRSNCRDMAVGIPCTDARECCVSPLPPSTSFSSDCFSGSLPSHSVLVDHWPQKYRFFLRLPLEASYIVYFHLHIVPNIITPLSVKVFHFHPTCFGKVIENSRSRLELRD